MIRQSNLWFYGGCDQIAFSWNRSFFGILIDFVRFKNFRKVYEINSHNSQIKK